MAQIDVDKDQSILLSDIQECTGTVKVSLIQWFDIIIDLELNRDQAQQIIDHLKQQFNL